MIGYRRHAAVVACVALLLAPGCPRARLLASDGGGQLEKPPGPRDVEPRDIALPEGYRARVVATGLTFPTQVAFDDRGRVHVTESGYSYGEVFLPGRLLRIESPERHVEIARSGNGPWTGVVHHEGAFYVAEGGELRGGRILRITPDGEVTALVDGLPSLGDHHTHVLASPGVRRFAARAGVGPGVAEEALRRHLGLCLDACHMAVGWEDPEETLSLLARAGLRVGKVQVSAALEAEAPTSREGMRALSRFADHVYLHQVVARSDGALSRWRDLPDALDDAAREPRRGVWRIHFHVPVFRERLGTFRSTQPYLRELLAACVRRDACDCYEVETYTWDVLPAVHRAEDLALAIAMELTWAERHVRG